MAPEQKKRVNLMDLGHGRGQAVPLSGSQLREAGLDPEADLEANRYVFDSERAEIRIRLFPQDE